MFDGSCQAENYTQKRAGDPTYLYIKTIVNSTSFFKCTRNCTLKRFACFPGKQPGLEKIFTGEIHSPCACCSAPGKNKAFKLITGHI